MLGIFKTFQDLLKNSKKDDNINNLENKISELESEIEILKTKKIEEESAEFTEHEQKVLNVLIDHGLEHKLIYPFLKQFVNPEIKLQLSQQSDLKSVLDLIDDDMLQKMCELFGINYGWFFDSEHLYISRHYYKNIHRFIDCIFDAFFSYERVEAFAIKSTELNFKSDSAQPIYLVLRTPIGKIFNKEIYKYYPIETQWDWEYWRTRYQLKSIFRLQDRYQSYFHLTGLNVESSKMKKFNGNNIIPHKLIEENYISSRVWYTYDYANTEKENCNAKETTEIELIKDYITENRYFEYSEESKEKALLKKYK